MPSDEREHALLAVLFTDIVGSSELAARMGDEPWERLLRRHHEILRTVVGNNGGRIVDTAGDGMFAVFARPAAAIRCAFEASQELRAIGLEIRAGIHFGETESSEGRVSGIVVHTAARVMSVAGPGEILITRTVGDLVAGKRITIGERGSHELKGIPSRWDVFAVEEVEGRRRPPPIDPEDARTLRERASVPAEPRRRVPIVVVAIVAAALALMGIVRAAGDGGPPVGSAVAPTTLVRVDSETHAREEVAIGDGVGSIDLGEGSVWLASFRDSTVYRVDPATLRVEARISMFEPPQEIAVGAGDVWVTTSSTLVRIDAVTEEIVERVALAPCGPTCTTDVAASGEAVWATHYEAERLVRLDPGRAGSERRRHLASRPVALAVDDVAVWLLHDDQVPSFLVERIDVASGQGDVRSFPFEAHGPLHCLEQDVGSDPVEPCATVTVGRQAVWVIAPGDEVSWLWRLDPDDGRRTGPGVKIACCATAMVASPDLVETLWIGTSSGEILQVPEVEGAPSGVELTIGVPVTDLAIGYGAIWASVDDPAA